MTSKFKQHFVIHGRLPSFNEYINRERTNRYAAAGMKKTLQARVAREIRAAGLEPVQGRILIEYHYYEQNRRRDLDNVAALAHKITQDALVETGILKNDNWKYITGFSDTFDIDKDAPRIEVTLCEEKEGR